MSRCRRRVLQCIVALVAITGLPISPASPLKTAHAAVETYSGNQVIVTLASGQTIATFNADHGTTTLETLPDSATYVVALPSTETTDEAVAQWATNPEVASAEPNYRVDLLAAERFYLAFDRFYLGFDGGVPASASGQWALRTIEAPTAQKISLGQGITVAVLDTGVDPTHPALASHVAVGGYDYISGTDTISDVAGGPASGHGTFVAGLIAQVAPQATILPFRVLDTNGLGTVGDVASAIETATDDGARVINLSMGMAVSSRTLHAAISYAQSHGVVVVASAGNQGSAIPQYPAAYDSVIAVAGTDQQDQRASFSNYGDHIVVSAPAVDLYSAYPGGYAYGSGTSFAAPLVSGELALLDAVPGGMDSSRASDLVKEGSINIDALNPLYTGLLGAGRIDALSAVLAACSIRRADGSP